jgi:hypothetical protein
MNFIFFEKGNFFQSFLYCQKMFAKIEKFNSFFLGAFFLLLSVLHNSKDKHLKLRKKKSELG